MNLTKVIFTCSLTAVTASVAFGQVFFQRLGTLPGGTSPISRAYGVSDTGLTVVGSSSSAVGKQAFRWTAADGMVGLGILEGGLTSVARRVSANGSVVVGESQSTAGEVAFRWTATGGMVSLGDLEGGTVNSNALGLSANGSVVVGEGRDASNHKAFRWVAGSGMASLGLLGGTLGESHGYDVSGDGTVVCGYSSDQYNRLLGFRWTAATGMKSLGDLPGGTVESRAYGMSRNGLYVVGRSDSGYMQAFRWFNNKMTGLGVLPGHLTSRARAVTDDGTAVVGRAGNDTLIPELLTAFIWTDRAGMQDLKNYLAAAGATGLEGWHLEEAEAVTPDGKFVVGHGTNPQGFAEAWVAKLPQRLVTHSLVPPAVVGGLTASGTVKVNYASNLAQVVALTSSNSSVATVPATVTIPPGQLSAVYTVTTKGVSATSNVVISATLSDETRTATLAVKPATLKSITASPLPFYGGIDLTCKVSLTGAAPPGGAVINLTTSNAAIVSAPSTITIPYGNSSGTYAVGTPGVNADAVVSLGASYLGLTANANLTVKRAILASIALKPSSVFSGKTTSVAITLLGKAGPGGRTINLSSGDPALLSLPSSVTVAEGSSTARVVGTAAAVANTATVDASALLAGITKSATLTIKPPTLAKIGLSLSSVTGGTIVKGTVTLNGLAPAGGLSISLASSNSSVASVPPTVTVLAGKGSAVFSVTTYKVTSSKPVTISAIFAGTTVQAALTVNP